MNGRNQDELGYYTRPKSLTKVHFLNPRHCEIKLEDVSFHLARSRRFNNGIDLSVAEHSVLMANWFLEGNATEFGGVEKQYKFARQSLIHDTNEYLFGDIPATIKKMLPDYEKFEKPFEQFMFLHFGVEYPMYPEVKLLDRRMCSTEQKVLRGHEPDTYEEPILEDVTFHLWGWEEAENNFLVLFNYLFPDYKDTEDEHCSA